MKSWDVNVQWSYWDYWVSVEAETAEEAKSAGVRKIMETQGFTYWIQANTAVCRG